MAPETLHQLLVFSLAMFGLWAVGAAVIASGGKPGPPLLVLPAA
ncbi:MAG TPA: hypothetical protein VFN18_00310 [Solirubrobacterales bacterium]|nr:hypothetical protein [Solirubrobacterales bacterium]